MLATKGVFARPWCLLEMHHASKIGTPVLLIEINGGGFDVSDAAVDPPEATSLPWRGDLTPRGRPERAHVPEPKPQSPSTPGGRKQLPKTHSFLEGGEARAALYGR